MSDHSAVSLGLTIDALSGLFILLLGLFVVSRRPIQRMNIAFTVFALSWGISFLVGNISAMWDHPWPAIQSSTRVAQLIATVAVLYIGLQFPTPIRPGWMLILPTLLFLATAINGLMTRPDFLDARLVFLTGAFLSVSFLCAIRFTTARGPDTGRVRAQCALVGAAFVMDPGIRTAMWFVRDSATLVIALAMLIVAVSWLWATTRVPAPASRAARNVALLGFALPFLGLILAVWIGPDAALDSGIMGLARTMTVIVVAYAILKHRLLNIDLKVRWGISKATLAAAFIAMFFVVSEFAKVFFEGVMNSTILGILAAGGLIFAIAPLQRMADRLAEKAVPVTGPPRDGSQTEPDGAEAYRRAVKIAMKAGITPEEERDLALLADKLGVSSVQAFEIRDDLMKGEKKWK